MTHTSAWMDPDGTAKGKRSHDYLYFRIKKSRKGESRLEIVRGLGKDRKK